MITKRSVAAGLGAGILATVLLLGSAPADAVVIGAAYEHNGYVGAARQWSGPNVCTPSNSNTDYQLVDLSNADVNFNDIISSFWGGNNCELKLFEHRNYAGSSLGYFQSSDSVGPMNDLTSSIRFS